MNRIEASKFCREELNKYGFSDWSVRLNQSDNIRYYGLCSYKDKAIILSAMYVDGTPDELVINTIRHEVAHALCPGHQHDSTWADMARKIGCIEVSPCSSYTLTDELKDAIRSGADIEFTMETEVIHRPKYQITRLQDKCEICGKVAKEIRSIDIKIPGDTKPDLKYIWLECGHLIVKKIPKGTPFHSHISNFWKPEIAECKHEWNINQCTKCSEFKLFPFQTDGARFLEAALSVNKGGAAFDEMGLGKTVQALSYLKYHDEQFPVLFVVKSGIKFQWFKEILRWLGPKYVAQVIGTSRDYVIPNLKCYIISYDLMVPKVRTSKKTGVVSTQGFDITKLDFIKTVVMDECQQIKNPDSNRTKEVRKLVKDKQVIALSGTPWKNRGSEFFTILNVLAPMKFPSYQGFLDRWVDTYFDGKYTKQGGIRNVEKFREYIKDIAVRREVADVAIEMPDVVRTLHFTELDNLSQESYDDEVSDFVKWYNDKVIGGTEDSFDSSSNILAKLARMRHITGLAKIPATVEFAEDFAEETDRKLTIFVHHKDVGLILYKQLQEKFPDISVMSLTADLSSEERFNVQERFQNSKRAFLVASTLASGEGINLQTCGDAIMHERQWNEANESQAAPGRFRRIGATHKRVNVTFMTAAGTVDEILANIVERKRAQFHNAMNRSEMPLFSEKSFAKELAEGIVKAHNESGKKSITKMASL